MSKNVISFSVLHIYILRLVKNLMLHTCTEDSICRQNKDGSCAKGYPKAYSNDTVITGTAPPMYRRPFNDRIIEKKIRGVTIQYDNRYVVPHNRYLLMKYKCHINVEKVGIFTFL